MLDKKICKHCCREKTLKEMVRLGSLGNDVRWFDKAFEKHWSRGLVHCIAFNNNDIVIDSDVKCGIPARCPYVLEQTLRK